MFGRQLFQPVLLSLLIASSATQAADVHPKAAGLYANDTDKALAGTFAAREKDWRNGAIVYQVLVDRFAPSTRLTEKNRLIYTRHPKYCVYGQRHPSAALMLTA